MRHEEQQHQHIERVRTALLRQADILPHCVEIHPTDRCNHRCAWCFHGGLGHDESRKGDLLSLGDYHKLFADMRELGIGELSIAGGGEPTLDSRLPLIIDAALERRLRIRLVTHGNILSKDLLPRLLRCTEIRMSLDAATPATYAQVRRVPEDYFWRALENLDLLLARRKKGTPRVGVSYVVSRHNHGEVAEFCTQMLKRPVDSVVLKYDIFSPIALPEISADARADPRLEQRTQATQPSGGCVVPYFKVALNPYGDLYSCCLGSQPGETNGYRLGNVRESWLGDVWAASRALRTRMRFRGVNCQSCNHTDSRINLALAGVA